MSQALFQGMMDSVQPEGGWKAEVLRRLPSYAVYVDNPHAVHYWAAPTVSFKVDNGPGSLLMIHHPVLGTLLKMYFKNVESCCAMKFLYGFGCEQRDLNNPIVPDALFKKMVDKFLKLHANDSYFSSRRLIINMVQSSGGSDPLADDITVDPSRIAYKRLYDYFHSNAAKVNVMHMPNSNTSNVIHHMEVLFPKDYFNKV